MVPLALDNNRGLSAVCHKMYRKYYCVSKEEYALLYRVASEPAYPWFPMSNVEITVVYY